MWYLSRTGQIEGPFNEAVVIDMIRSRLLDDGHVCPVGGNEWIRVAQHAPFAEALRARDAQPVAPAAPVAAPAPSPAPAPVVDASNAPTVVAPASARSPFAPAMSPTPAPVAPQSMGPQSMGPMPVASQNFGPQSMGPMPAAMRPSMHSMPPGPGSYMPSPSLAPQSYFVPQPQAKSSSKAGVIVGVLGALFVIVGGGAFAAWFFFFRAPASLAEVFPDTTEAYAEIRGLKTLHHQMADVEVVDPSRIEDKKPLVELQTAITQSFNLGTVDALRVALGIHSVAVGAHDLSRDKASVAVVIGWDDKGAAEALLASDRFVLEGDVGKGGKRYSLKRRELSPEKASTIGNAEKLLSELQLDAKNKDDQLVWFPAKKILVLANERGIGDVTDVVEGGKKSLKEAPLYVAQKARRENGAALVGFVDTGLIKNVDAAKAFQKYFVDTGAVAISSSLEKGGLRTTISGVLSGTEDNRLSAFDDSKTLSLPAKLPKETFGYVAFSSKTALKGKAARDEFMKELAAKPEAAAAQKSIEEGEQMLGVDLATLFDALGDEGVFATEAKDGFKYDGGAMPSFDDLAVVYAQRVNDPAAAKRLVSTLRTKFGSGLKIQANGDDFVVDGEKPMPRAEVRFLDGMLVGVVGSRDLADRTFASLSGKGGATLAQDHAHAIAVEPLQARHFLLWIDAGRVGDTVLASMPSLKDEATKNGVDLGMVRLTGEHRATAALAMNFAKKDGKVAYTIDSMNVALATPLLAAFGKHGLVAAKEEPIAPSLGSAGSLGALSGSSKLGSTPSGGSFGALGAKTAPKTDLAFKADAKPANTGDDLPPVCAAALDRYDRCVYKQVPASSRPKLIKSLRDTITRQDPKWRATTCQSLIDAADRSNPACK